MTHPGELTKMTFPLDVQDDWPPVPTETVWVRRGASGQFAIENIPFFVPDLALHDQVEGQANEDGELIFARKVSGGGHATIRVVFLEDEDRALVEDQLLAKGCRLERSPWKSLIALDVVTANVAAVATLLGTFAGQGVLEYET